MMQQTDENRSSIKLPTSNARSLFKDPPPSQSQSQLQSPMSTSMSFDSGSVASKSSSRQSSIYQRRNRADRAKSGTLPVSKHARKGVNPAEAMIRPSVLKR